MKACRTISGAVGVAVVAGLVGAVLGGLALARYGPTSMKIGAVIGALAVGFTTLLIKYPRWQSDL